MADTPYLDSAILDRIERLELRARGVVEGFISGLHRSPFRGFSVEFADYRGYVPGDDLKHLDWRTYARTGRYFVKQYELETNLIAHVLLDVSESMAYHSPESAGDLSKLEYGKLLAASLAFLIVKQSDAVGLGLFDNDVREFVRHSSMDVHVQQLCATLETTEAQNTSSTGAALRAMNERISRRGIVVIISDLFDSIADIQDAIQRLRVRRHEVILFHLLDEYELTFPFEGPVQFHGLETGMRVSCNPRLLREAYLEEVDSYLEEIRRVALNCGADYCRINTKTPVETALAEYLAIRQRLARGSQAAGGYR